MKKLLTTTTGFFLSMFLAGIIIGTIWAKVASVDKNNRQAPSALEIKKAELQHFFPSILFY